MLLGSYDDDRLKKNERLEGLNILTADEDRRFRKLYLQGGQIAFSSIIATSILLPAGIGLTITGGRLLARQRKIDEKSGRSARVPRSRIRASFAPRLLDLRF